MVTSIEERLARARKRVETLERLERIKNANPVSIIPVILDGIKNKRNIDIKILISIARARKHWHNPGKLVQCRRVIDGTIVTYYEYTIIPSGTDAEYVATWHYIGDDLRLAYYDTAVALGAYMPTSDGLIGNKPLDKGDAI